MVTRAVEQAKRTTTMVRARALDPEGFAPLAERAGYTVAEMLGRNCRMFQGAETDPDAVETMRRAVAAERAVAVTLLNYRRDSDLERYRTVLRELGLRR